MHVYSQVSPGKISFDIIVQLPNLNPLGWLYEDIQKISFLGSVTYLGLKFNLQRRGFWPY